MVDAIGRNDALYQTQRVAARDDSQQVTNKTDQNKREAPTDTVDISPAAQQILKLAGRLPLVPLTGAQALGPVERELKALMNELNIPADSEVTIIQNENETFSVTGNADAASRIEEILNDKDKPSALGAALIRAHSSARLEFDAAQWAAVARDPNGTGPGISENGGMTVLTRSIDYSISWKNEEISGSFFDKQGNPASPEGTAEELSQWVPFLKTPVLNRP
ncbi:MAG: hypothetical protein MI743_05255 [Sneathiellales bacterium]|nr:hypothetical protein [Sneathiellales bacterium]